MSVVRVTIEFDTRDDTTNPVVIAEEVVKVLNDVDEEGLEDLGEFSLIDVQERKWVSVK